MIYLFEDRDDRKKQLMGDSSLHPLVCQKPFDCFNVEDIGDYIINNFSDAKAVLLHKSYSFANSAITTDSVKKEFAFLLDIPVVLFSGGSKSSLIKEGVIITAEVNSGVMYRNLNLFIESYQREGVICIPMLVYGKHYQINQLLEMQAKLYSLLFDKKDDDILKSNEDRRKIRKIMQIISDVNDSSLSVDIEKLKNWIKDKDDKNELQISLLKQTVQNLIIKYRV